MSGKICEWHVGALFDSNDTKENLEEVKALFRMLIDELNEVIDPGYRLKIIFEATTIQEWQDALEKGSLDLCLMYCMNPVCEQIILNTPRASYIQFVYIAGLLDSRLDKKLKEADNFFEVELDVKGSIIKGLNEVGFGFHQIVEKENVV